METIEKWLTVLFKYGAVASLLIIAAYSYYQQTMLYPAMNQQIGYQQCVAEVNAQVAKQQQLTQPDAGNN